MAHIVGGIGHSRQYVIARQVRVFFQNAIHRHTLR